MPAKRSPGKDLSLLRLIAITDDLRDGEEGLVARAAAAARGGATCVQVRLKDATPREIVAVAAAMVKALQVPVIVNDRADLALAAGAAGVHVGPADLPVRAVRRIVPAGFIIGASFGDETELENAERADYAGIGPIAATGSKPDAGAVIGVEGFRKLSALVKIPAVAVGGVTAAIAREFAADAAVRPAGFAAMSAIFGASDPERAAFELSSAIGK